MPVLPLLVVGQSKTTQEPVVLWFAPEFDLDQPTRTSPFLGIDSFLNFQRGKLGLGPIVWHTFRHNYRSWLDETGAPMKVQQELMRHASIQTTMNVDEQTMPASKREENGESRGNGTQADESERLKH